MHFGKYCLLPISALFFLLSGIVNAENNTNINTNKAIVQQNKQIEIKETAEMKESKNRNNNNTNNIKNNKTHIVQNGENIYRISLKYNIKQDELIKLNNIKNNFIKVGQKLVLPDNAILDTTLVKAKETTNSQQQDNDASITPFIHFECIGNKLHGDSVFAGGDDGSTEEVVDAA